jgi:hypothetical protein
VYEAFSYREVEFLLIELGDLVVPVALVAVWRGVRRGLVRLQYTGLVRLKYRGLVRLQCRGLVRLQCRGLVQLLQATWWYKQRW